MIAFVTCAVCTFTCVQRKLLVEKRVVLDDIPNADRKSDRLLATLPPRSPTIQRGDDSPSPTISKLHTSKSEYSVSRSKTLPTDSASQATANRPQSARVRLATSISVGNSLSTRSGHQTADGHPAHGDAVGSWKVHDINEVREPQNAKSSYEPGRVRASVAASRSGKVSSAVNPVASSSQQAGVSAYTAAAGCSRTDRDQQKHVAGNVDGAKSASHGARPRSVPPKLLHQQPQAADTQCSDSMGAQYEPGNVRHLVQTFQSAFRPPVTAEHGGDVVDQTSVHASARTADESHQTSMPRDRLQAADRPHHRQTFGDAARDQRWPTGQRTLHGVVPRTDANVNVCVVRPATGRSLPRPPTPEQSSSLVTFRPSTPNAQELPNQPEQSDTRSSNKVSKLWQAYGCV